MDVTAAGSLLKLTFAFDRRIIDCIKTVPGYVFNDADKCWYVPAVQLARLEELFPRAHFDYAVWQAEAAAMQRSAQQLHTMLARSGATFRVTEDDIVLVDGDCVSPLVSDVVRERSAWIAPLVGNVATVKSPPVERMAVEPTRFDELLATGIANAVKADAQKRQYGRRKWRRSEVRQGELGI